MKIERIELKEVSMKLRQPRDQLRAQQDRNIILLTMHEGLEGYSEGVAGEYLVTPTRPARRPGRC